MKRILLTFSLLSLTYIISAQTHRAIPLVHPEGRFFSSGLNNHGQVCGSAFVDSVNFINHAVRYEPDGSFTMLTLGPNGKSATASEINEYGHVLGAVQNKRFHY